MAKVRTKLDPGVKIDVWFQDEARIAQKNKITRRWAAKGSRPRAPHDQRTVWIYICGAICPAEGRGAGLVLPWFDSEAMNLHLQAISAKVATGAHAVVLVDRAGWHLTPKLAIPRNISIIALPPRSPELNPTENVWQFVRDNRLSNRFFKFYDDIVDHCCRAWNKLLTEPCPSDCATGPMRETQ
ncbi:MAG: IS630 family transposase [Hyphomonadaceae bacterium]|nr:IS630 family transposase [Hyphomonadaceae bacterium]MBY0423245.1 IS630 family transposase [Parvularculaceae bacterium]